MSIAAELTKLQHSAIVELFVLDAEVLGGGVFRFHNNTNALHQPVVWRGETYTPFSIQAEGFEISGDGPLPRPKARVSNHLGLIGALNRDYRNLLGASLVRRRTLARFLDAVNFPEGVNPTADPTAGYPDDLWVIDRKSFQDNRVCEYELASPLDVAGVKLPRRPVIARVCTSGYRTPECGYTGPPVATIIDVPTADPALDQCSLRLSGCRFRFGTDPDGLPFGGFPGAGQIANL